MEIKVNEDELDLVNRNMDKDADDLETSIEKIIAQLEILKGIWQGQDADKFFANTDDYFNTMKGLPRCMRNMGKFINRANKDFNDGDSSFSKELETEVEEEYLEKYKLMMEGKY